MAKQEGYSESLGNLVLLCIFGFIIWLFLPDRWTDKIKYSIEYSVDSAQVHRSNKPTDCDWSHAPLGNKDCHYKKNVTGYNAAGYPVAGDDAPKYAKNAYGTTIVSYDEGKTWTTSDTPGLDLNVKTVEIGWTKVNDN